MLAPWTTEAKFPSPLYEAESITGDPWGSAVVVQVATPAALTATFWHPAIAAPFALKFTVPVGVPLVVDVTVAVMVADWPTVIAVGEAETVMVTLPFPTVTLAFAVPERKDVLPL